MKVYIDSNIFVYVAIRHPQFGNACKAFLSTINQKEIVGVTSALTLCEVHHAIAKYLDKKAAELVIQSILSLPIEIIALDSNMFCSAIHQIREHNLKINDAVHFSVALATKTDKLYSYDKDFDGLEIPRAKP